MLYSPSQSLEASSGKIRLKSNNPSHVPVSNMSLHGRVHIWLNRVLSEKEDNWLSLLTLLSLFRAL